MADAPVRPVALRPAVFTAANAAGAALIALAAGPAGGLIAAVALALPAALAGSLARRLP